MTNRIEFIDIDRIKFLENPRSILREKDLASLMESIRNQGLQQPIGLIKLSNGEYMLKFGSRRLTACKKLGYDKIRAEVTDDDLNKTDLLLVSIAENLHRKDLNPVELGSACERLKEGGLSESEIAVRLAQPIGRIRSAIKIFRTLPKKYHQYTEFHLTGTRRSGKIPANVLIKLIQVKKHMGLKISDYDFNRLFEYMRVNDMNRTRLELIVDLMSRGMTLSQAFKENENYIALTPRQLLFKKEDLEKLKSLYPDKNIGEIIEALVREKLKR